MKHVLFASVLAALAAPAAAQITAQDVLSNQSALIERLGATLDATLDNGTASDITITAEPGFDFLGTLTITLPDIAYAQAADGTLVIDLPSPFTLGLTLSSSTETVSVPELGGPLVDLAISMTHDDYQIVASGAPGDITYNATATNVVLELSHYAFIYAGPSIDDMVLRYSYDALWIETRIVEDDLLTWDFALTSDPSQGLSVMPDAWLGLTETTRTATQGGTIVANAVLPAGVMDMPDIDAALAAGLELQAHSDYIESVNAMERRGQNGEVLYSDRAQLGTEILFGRLAQDGLIVELTGIEGTFGWTDRARSADHFELTFNQASISGLVPLLASADPQPAGLTLNAENVLANDVLWQVIDPSGALDQTIGANLTFDLQAEILMPNSLFELISLMGGFMPVGPLDLPVPVSLVLSDLSLELGGATLQASGQAQFDPTDTQTWGFAAPSGQLLASASGLTELVDAAETGGLLPADTLRDLRLGLALLAEPDGEGGLQSDIELTPDGQLFVNGQRLQ